MIDLFAGCKIGIEEHAHTFAESWSSDAEYHWHEATCGHVTEVKGKEVHKWNDGKVRVKASCTEDGIKTFTCTTCKKK